MPCLSKHRSRKDLLMDASSELDPLANRLKQPDLARLLARLVARLRRGQPLVGRLKLKAPSIQERRAVAGLVGGRTSGEESLSIDLSTLAALATRDGRFASLRDLIVAAHGTPVEDERARRRSQHAAWDNLWQQADEQAKCWEPVRAWLSAPNSRGWVRRCCRNEIAVAGNLLHGLFAVLDRLPVRQPISLSQLAAETLGDSHALDPDTALGRIALRGVAALTGREPPRRARAIRGTWSAAGVVLDELSATVLVLNLPGLPGTPLGDALALHRQQGEPCRITFRQLHRNADCQFDRSCGHSIYVCENPSVLASAADRWQGECRPLVCVEGQPNLAAEQLLRVLTDQGFLLRYHGDFDWAGIRIATRLWYLFGFGPWRFGAADYRSAPAGRRLSGRSVATPWDPVLRLAMEELGCTVHEEAVLGELLSDLSL